MPLFLRAAGIQCLVDRGGGRRYRDPGPQGDPALAWDNPKGQSQPQGWGCLWSYCDWITTWPLPPVQSCLFHFLHRFWTWGHHPIYFQLADLLWVGLLGNCSSDRGSLGKGVPDRFSDINITCCLWWFSNNPGWLHCAIQHASRSPTSIVSRCMCREWKWILIVASAIYN